MATAEEIRSIIGEANKALRADVAKDILEKVGTLINETVDKRLKDHEEKIMKELQTLKTRTEALENMSRVDNSTGASWGGGSKRARSEPPQHSRAQHETKPVVVLTGFPANSRKADIESFLKCELGKVEEWKGLHVFAPNVRSTVAMVRVHSKDAVFDFISKWKPMNIEYKGSAIRARADKTPEQRRSNAKIYQMAEYLKKTFIDKDIDADYKQAAVWVKDWKLVEWDRDASDFVWDDGAISSSGLTVDKLKAEEATR
ncbi:unnamed protein product [Prorocentrum cordatum]|uniref:RRM domain-containing protein n=1 Tax=Prorocentrum cordatum TaxID=2364126 RepID=A0ABN9Q7T8_9DINO|nr:unnamed protein product [Polarella glacialis]